MKRLCLVSCRLGLLVPLHFALTVTAHAQDDLGATSQADLFQTIASLDAAVFDAYNRCDLETFGSFFADDLEFYHDRTGLSHSRQSLVAAVEKNICGKVRRKLIPETLQVFPLHTFGAVELGIHRFCSSQSQHCDENSGTGRFIHLWQDLNGTWKITRVISYDHVDR
jgi:ketosteroid isomerase-like protein